MNIRLAFIPILFFALVIKNADAQGPPFLFAKNEDRQSILSKIETETWAQEAWSDLQQKIDVYVDRHQTDPDWIISRLSMYWKEGERYTQCYIKKQNWDYGEGDAPVPTVRLPGMRTWNSYINVPLEDRLPYSENGDMLAIDRAGDDKTPVRVPYKKTGHMVRYNNLEILSLAEEASFAYWLTQEEKYATFAADIFYTWLLGTYYMEPPLDPEKSTGGYGGYEPGGIMGYYDYEQIHDDLQIHAAYTYDFLYDYLKNHPHEHLSVIGKNVVEVAGVVFKRYVELGLVRGGKQGNWNVNGFKNIVPSMLVLESNDFYKDKKGTEHYIPYYTEITTDYHEALPDFIKNFDEVTGLWPESPGYASGMISVILDIGMPLYKSGVNTIADNPLLQKAAMANLGWLDARGNLVLFGDMRGGPTNFSVFENMLAYYSWQGDTENAKKMATVIRKGIASEQYDRSEISWKGLCLYQPLPESGSELPYHKAAYSAHHRHLIMKNGNSEENGLMFTLYGGKKGGHLSNNGLCMQFYGNGFVLNPDASAYESYWSDDAKYHRGIAGSNTILPGYARGEIHINAMDPAVDASQSFYNASETSAHCSFADVSADEKRRLVAMIRTSPTTGYYVDIFRSDQDNNDYLQHIIGNTVELKNSKGQSMPLTKMDSISRHYDRGYSFFQNIQRAKTPSDFRATWTTTQLEKAYHVDMWMMGQKNREVYLMDAPPSTLRSDLTPGGVNKSPQTTPTMMVRQSDNNARSNPFVAVFEAYQEGEKAIGSITKVASDENFVCLEVDAKKLGKQLILNAVDKKIYKPQKQVEFQGTFGLIAERAGRLDYLYLGSGTLLKKGKLSIEAVEGEVAAELRYLDGKYYYTANKKVKIATENKKAQIYPAGENLVIK